MDIHIHIEKKHLYIFLAVLAVFTTALGAILVFAAHGDLTPYTVGATYHFLQDVVKNDAKVSVDADNNGVIDTTDDVTCIGCIDSGNVLDGTITSGDIADGTITSGDIADGAITTADINAGSFSYAASPSASGPATNANACSSDGVCDVTVVRFTANNPAPQVGDMWLAP